MWKHPQLASQHDYRSYIKPLQIVDNLIDALRRGSCTFRTDGVLVVMGVHTCLSNKTQTWVPLWNILRELMRAIDHFSLTTYTMGDHGPMQAVRVLGVVLCFEQAGALR